MEKAHRQGTTTELPSGENNRGPHTTTHAHEGHEKGKKEVRHSPRLHPSNLDAQSSPSNSAPKHKRPRTEKTQTQGTAPELPPGEDGPTPQMPRKSPRLLTLQENGAIGDKQMQDTMEKGVQDSTSNTAQNDHQKKKTQEGRHARKTIFKTKEIPKTFKKSETKPKTIKQPKTTKRGGEGRGGWLLGRDG